MRVWMALTIAVAGALTAAPAVADDEAPQAATPTTTTDVVVLRTGEVAHGRVSELVPNDHVTLRLLTGEEHRIAWGDIERVEIGTARAAEHTPATGQVAEPQPPPTLGPSVFVHIASSRDVYLYRRPAGSAEWLRACESPCDRELPLADTYKIGGGGVTTSKEFRLQGQPGQTVVIDVSGPSWLGIIGGGSLAIVGGTTAYVGLVLTTLNDSSVRAAGLGALAAGGAILAVGLLIVFPSMKTSLSQKTRSNPGEALVRRPQWRAGAETDARLPQATFPLLFERRF